MVNQYQATYLSQKQEDAPAQNVQTSTALHPTQSEALLQVLMYSYEQQQASVRLARLQKLQVEKL